jgi:hypothetical protein
LDAGESCGLFLGATTSVFDTRAMDFWDIARDAKMGVAANQTTESIAAQLAEFRQVVGSGADVATVAEFGAKVFASEVLLTNLGNLSFDRQFGPVTLEAIFGPAVLAGFEGQQTIGVATVNGALCLLHTSHTPPDGLLEKTESVLIHACDERVRSQALLNSIAEIPHSGSVDRVRANSKPSGATRRGRSLGNG